MVGWCSMGTFNDPCQYTPKIPKIWWLINYHFPSRNSHLNGISYPPYKRHHDPGWHLWLSVPWKKVRPCEIFFSRDNKNLTKVGVLFDNVFMVRYGPIKTLETSNLPWFEGSKDRRALWSFCETLAAQGNAQVNCSRLLGILYNSILIYIKN